MVRQGHTGLTVWDCSVCKAVEHNTYALHCDMGATNEDEQWTGSMVGRYEAANYGCKMRTRMHT